MKKEEQRTCAARAANASAMDSLALADIVASGPSRSLIQGAARWFRVQTHERERCLLYGSAVDSAHCTAVRVADE